MGQRNYVGRICQDCDYRWSGPLDEACPECGWQSNITRITRTEGGVLPEPIDWHHFWTVDPEQADWLVEDFWPTGRAMALYAQAKQGKSEFVLHCMVCLATGTHPFTGASMDPVTVCYFDFEMTRDDLWDRLVEMGYTPRSDLSRLRYYQLPMMPPMDTERGGEVVREILERDQPRAVIVDTFGRAVQGEEDKADTVRAFYSHTGLAMKNLGTGYLRTDHAGKSLDRGQRGSSAKSDDVDVIWQLERSTTGLTLTSTSRVAWVPQTLEVDRIKDPLHYTRPTAIGGYTVAEFTRAKELDALGIPRSWGRKRIYARLVDLGLPTGNNQTLTNAIRWRKSQCSE
jgi:hypothetical protein